MINESNPEQSEPLPVQFAGKNEERESESEIVVIKAKWITPPTKLIALEVQTLTPENN